MHMQAILIGNFRGFFSERMIFHDIILACFVCVNVHKDRKFPVPSPDPTNPTYSVLDLVWFLLTMWVLKAIAKLEGI